MQFRELKRMNATERINDGSSTSAAGAVGIMQVEQTVYICSTSRGSSQPPDKLLKVITFQSFEKEGLHQA
ncbi:hypothetical protein TNCV_1181831 [Trichonephila clavipes]|nr:hypothetical protein TNCV_1181831 [Trichonephila clavipes]